MGIRLFHAWRSRAKAPPPAPVYGTRHWLPPDLHHLTRTIVLPQEGMTMTDTRIEMGDRVRDIVSGHEGIVTSRTEYLNGCVQFGVEPKAKPDGTLTTYNIDQQQLEVIEKRAVQPILPIVTLVSGERVEPSDRAPAAGGPTRPAPRQR